MQSCNPDRVGFVDTDGVSVRTLQGSKGTGFFIRVLSGGTEEPAFLDATKQPGHTTVTTTRQLAYHVPHPRSSIPERYYPIGIPPEPVEAAAVVDAIIDLGDNEVAKLALQHLVPPFSESVEA